MLKLNFLLVIFGIASTPFTSGWAAEAHSQVPLIEIGEQALQFEKGLATPNLPKTEYYMRLPPGNLGAQQTPDFPSYTKTYLRTILGLKFSAFYSLMTSNPTEFSIKMGKIMLPKILPNLAKMGFIAEAERLGKIFKLDPLQILAPIIGENTFNGAWDQTIQDSFAKMLSPADFEKMNKKMREMTNEPRIQACLKANIRNYWKWQCVINYSNFLTENSNLEVINMFYETSGKGTFGIGQAQPVLLWSLNDVVHEKLNFDLFELTDSRTPMQIVFNYKHMLGYIAAMIKNSVQLYYEFANVDISKNVGLTTTLYNIGDEYRHAAFYNEKRLNLDAGLQPDVNFMGWFINYFEADIRYFLKNGKLPANF